MADDQVEAGEEPEELKSAIDEAVRHLFREGRYGEAVPVIQEHLRGHADDTPAYELMATALRFSGDKAGAAGALMTAGELYGRQGLMLHSVAAQKMAMQLGVEPDFGAARAVAAADRVPTPLFDDLDDDEFRELAGSLTACEHAAGDTIVEEGSEADSMFVLVTGQVTVTTKDRDGSEVGLAELGPGDFFGESALLSGRPRTATVRARTAVRCLELGRVSLDEVVARCPRVHEVMEEFNGRRAESTIEALIQRREPSGG